MASFRGVPRQPKQPCTQTLKSLRVSPAPLVFRPGAAPAAGRLPRHETLSLAGHSEVALVAGGNGSASPTDGAATADDGTGCHPPGQRGLRSHPALQPVFHPLV